MLESQRQAAEVYNRLRNPVNGRQSEETEILSAPALRRQRVAIAVELEEQRRAEETQSRWDAVMDRLTAEASQAAAERAEVERVERERGIPTLEMIVRVVCGWYNISRLDLMSARRTASAVYPRHIAMYLCRSHTRFSLPQIGAKFGGRDHTTAIHAFNKIAGLINSGDEKVCRDIDRLRRVLGVE